MGGRLVSLLALLALLFVTAAAAEEKPLRGVALVIGNGTYEHLTKLPNPANDADAIEGLLSDLGFDSVRRADRGGAELKRDLERFAEDARDADVAVLYYSGHGIEAAGENYLVPVDADLSALDEASEKLVPVSALIAKLQAEVPVLIVMLDACRNNPFPPDAMVRVSAGGAAAPMTAGGLGQIRSAASIEAEGATPAATENVGSVLAFAAEPGRVALDGDAGGNSPYATAVLRHFSAMNGEEFGLVMRLVAEEVYLKTGGRQRPWMNESLRRLLHFGGTPKEADGAEGDILRERRKLLVTISTLPDAERRRIEKVSAEGGVPMDAVFAMLKAMGAEGTVRSGRARRSIAAQRGSSPRDDRRTPGAHHHRSRNHAPDGPRRPRRRRRRARGRAGAAGAGRRSRRRAARQDRRHPEGHQCPYPRAGFGRRAPRRDLPDRVQAPLCRRGI
jgi:uncharacterized caspase-like protein